MAAPSQPKGLNVSTGTVQNVLTWVAVPGADTYNVYRDDNPEPYEEDLEDPTFTDEVEIGEAHIYTITAVNEDGESIASYRRSAVGGNETHVFPLSISGLS